MSKVVKHFSEAIDAEGTAEAKAGMEEHKSWLLRVFELILTEDSQSIARLERELEVKQMEAVDDLIENTDWGSSRKLRRFRGKKGSPLQRLEAFRQALREQKIPAK